MLSRHYKSGMTSDTLCFHEVCADDQLVTGPGYMDVQTTLPELKGDDLWWTALPPNGESLLSGSVCLAERLSLCSLFEGSGAT